MYLCKKNKPQYINHNFELGMITQMILDGSIGASIFFRQDILSNVFLNGFQLSSLMNMESLLHFVLGKGFDQVEDAFHEAGHAKKVQAFGSLGVGILFKNTALMQY